MALLQKAIASREVGSGNPRDTSFGHHPHPCVLCIWESVQPSVFSHVHRAACETLSLQGSHVNSESSRGAQAFGLDVAV